MSNVITETELLDAISNTASAYSDAALTHIFQTVVENGGHGSVVSRGCLFKAINEVVYSPAFAREFPLDALKAAYKNVYNSGQLEKNGKLIAKGKDYTQRSVIDPAIEAGYLVEADMVSGERIYRVAKNKLQVAA